MLNAFLFVESTNRWNITKFEISSTELQTCRILDFFLSRNKFGVQWIYESRCMILMAPYVGPIFGKFWVGLGFLTDFIQRNFLLFVFAWTLGFTILTVPKYQNFDVIYVTTYTYTVLSRTQISKASSRGGTWEFLRAYILHIAFIRIVHRSCGA